MCKREFDKWRLHKWGYWADGSECDLKDCDYAEYNFDEFEEHVFNFKGYGKAIGRVKDDIAVFLMTSGAWNHIQQKYPEYDNPFKFVEDHSYFNAEGINIVWWIGNRIAYLLGVNTRCGTIWDIHPSHWRVSSLLPLYMTLKQDERYDWRDWIREV